MVLCTCVASLPGTAHAHAMFGSAAPFWTGVLHVLVTPLALAAVAAVVLALAEATESAVLCAVAGSALAAFGGAELSGAAASTSAIAAFAVAAIACTALLRRRPLVSLASVLGITGGAVAGCSVGGDVPDWGGSLGVGIALLVLTSWGAAGLAHLRTRFAEPVWMARRIAAATIAIIALAIGLAKELVGAIA